jgi:YidC/Oxa1 family membrane protein insertase
MDKKMYIAMVALFLLVMGYYAYIEKVVRPKHPEWDWTGQSSQLAQDGGVSSAGQATTQTQGSIATTGPTSPMSGLQAIGAPQPGQNVWIGSQKENDPDYALGLQVNPVGAALESAVINGFKSADQKTLYTYEEPYQGDWRALATQQISLNGNSVDVTGVPWKLESSTGAAAAFGLDVPSVLHVSKTFTVEPRGPKKTWDSTAAGYEVDLDYTVTNLTKSPQTVRLSFDGPTMPPREAERQDDRQIVTGYDKGNQAVDVSRYAATDFKPGSDSKDLSRSTNGYRMLWSGATSLYFSTIILPVNEGQLSTVSATAQNPGDAPEDRRIALSFQTDELKLAPGASVDVPLKIFMGPKSRAMLEGDYYSPFPRGYNQLLVTTTGFCGMCAFSWLIDFLVWFLGCLHWFWHDWGLSIITLVVIVRLILHPITKHSMVSTMKMQKMGPELERLKKKYGDDKEGYNKAQVQLYKEMGFTPILGCLPMFLQMPIWIALYSALQTEIELRQARFLWGLTWIHDLARPDRLITWDAHAFTLPLIGLHIASLNILPILMGIGYFLQQKYTPKPPAMTPEQAQQQKMMQYMTLLFPLFLYNAPSGLNLYILTSGGLGILENKRIRDHIKQKEEAEKAGKVFVETKATRQGKQQKKDDDDKTPKKVGFLARWWAELQDRAEAVRRENDRRNKK